MATKKILETVKTALKKHKFTGPKSTIQCEIEASSTSGPIKLDKLIADLKIDIKQDIKILESIFDKPGAISYCAIKKCPLYTNNKVTSEVKIIPGNDKASMKFTAGKTPSLELTIKFVLRTSTDNKIVPTAEIKKKK